MNDKKRARRIASDEAHAWARSLQLGNPNAKSVLRALTLYVNGEGACFVGIEQLAEDTDLSADTVRRRLVWLDQIGAIVRLPQWLDTNGRRNSDGKGKRTTDDIRLLLDADIEQIEARARGASEDISPSSVLPQDFTAEKVSPALALGQPSQSCEVLISEPEPESLPQPLSEGSVAIENDWKEFERDWLEPILRQSIAQQVWASLKPDERDLARKAARGYVAHRKAQKKPPNVLGAHLFLRERDAWPGYAKYDPSARSIAGGASGIPTDSREAKAVCRMYAVTRARPFEHKGRIVYPGEITPQILAFAEVGDRAHWPWIEASNQIRAWSDFIAANVFGPRGTMVIVRDMGGMSRTGIHAPHAWPPKKDGTWSTTGPPETFMTEEDMAEFQS